MELCWENHNEMTLHHGAFVEQGIEQWTGNPSFCDEKWRYIRGVANKDQLLPVWWTISHNPHHWSNAKFPSTFCDIILWLIREYTKRVCTGEQIGY